MTVRDATLAGMEVTPGCLRVSLLTDEGLTSVDMPLDAAAHHALGPLLTLHGHHHRCFGHVDVGVGLLLRTVDVLAGSLPRLVVRPEADPPLWLRLPDAEIALTTLDACCLLCSQRLPIALDHAPTT